MEGMKKNMLNQFVLVGRIEEMKDEKEGATVTIAVQQTFKNNEGMYDTNHIEVRIFGKIAEGTKEYCEVGDIVGVKGRMQKLESDDALNIIAEKISFLTGSRKDVEE